MKVLLTGAFNYKESQIEQIRMLGFDVDFIQHEQDEIDNCGEYDAVVCNGLFLHHDIKIFTSLRFIQLTSVGYDRVPLEYIKENNIKICNAAGVYNIPIAEHAILKILEVYKKSHFFYKNQANHIWEKERNIFELFGKKAVILGCGNIGREIAKRLKAFDVFITAVDVTEVNSPYVDKYENITNLHPVLCDTDILILTLPLTEKTRGIIDKNCFDKMKKSSIIINVSRGQVINQNDLVVALGESQIYGVALDVFEEEPLDTGDGLWDIPNVLITPHNSFIGENNNKRMFECLYKNLVKFIEEFRNENNGNISQK